jgi:sensor histidine kinase YesM
MENKIKLPKKSQMLVFSVLGGLLFTIMPFMITLEKWQDPRIGTRLLSIFVLFLLVISIFYCSQYVNMRLYKSSFTRKIEGNLIAFVAVTIISICLHYPFWELSTTSVFYFYVTDEVVRNIIIFLVCVILSHYYMKEQENKQIQINMAILERENLSNQVRGLIQQLNPHFFFNALNTLSGIVRENPEKSEVFIDKLSQVFRYVLKLEDYTIVDISEELKFMDDYIFLLKIRFEDMLNIRMNDTTDGKYKVVPLCTQLLLENVIKHNRINRQIPMNIDITIDDEYLTVSNTYLPKNNLNSSKLGLKNLNKRCELHLGKSIIVEQNNSLFTVKVPLIRA